MMTLPRVLHAGFPKCGSTFLQSVLRQRDDVLLVFKSEILSPFEQQIAGCDFRQKYEECFSRATIDQLPVESDEHLIMPLFHPDLGVRAITTASRDRILDQLVELFPNAKLIFVIRNQTDMIISTYSQYLLGGGTREINQFAKELLAAKSDGKNYFSVFFADLHDAVQARFGDQFLMLLLEDFRENQDLQLKRLFEFLELPAAPYKDTFTGRRIGLSVAGMQMMRACNRVLARSENGRLTERFWIPHSLYRLARNLIRIVDHYALSQMFTMSKRDLLTRQTKQMIRAMFASDNLKLADKMGRDLNAIGYCCDTVSDHSLAVESRPAENPILQ